MADKKISELDAITGANTAATDAFVVVDTSTGQTKKITREELNNAIEQDVLSTVDINGGTIDGTVIGGTTAAAGSFTTLDATGNITVGGTVDGRDVATDGTKLDGIEASATADQTGAEIATALNGETISSLTALTTTGAVIVGGDFTVNGTTTTINSTTLTVDDKNIELASGAADAAAANGSGITIDGASATFTYVSTGDKWQLNKPLDVTGNIIVSGTVDGRDVAADGTKLDGIEAGATADQTAAEIRALVESATDSNVFTDADHTKLDGVEAGATADQTGSEIATALNGETLTGIASATVTGDLTVDTDTLHVDSTNNRVGIGTSSPSVQFETNSNGFGHRIEGVSASNYSVHRFVTDTSDTDKFIIAYGASHPVPHQIAIKAGNAAGTVGLYTAGSEGARLLSNRDFHVDGNVVAYSTTISDIRLKKDIAPIEDAVTKVQQLNGCTFTYLKDDRKSAGLIAQDVEKVLPSAVIEDEAVFHGEEGETYKTVQYDQVIGLLVEAVKELKAEIEELKNGTAK